jgi:single-stranded-DNA-specific exonuclease
MSKSILGKKWSQRPSNDNLVQQLVQRLGISEVIARLLNSRGITLEQTESFLSPKIKDLLPDPFHLKDMDKGVSRVIEAITRGDSICIFGDYDVDGATSSALLKRFFRDINIDVMVYIPDRIKEGYGPSAEIMRALKAKAVDLVITVDCGAMAFDALSAAKDISLDVIVLDHHIGGAELPEGVAIINPNRLDELSEYRYLAAVGVSFLFIVALVSKLKTIGFFNDKPCPDILQYLDLVALGTVCDVMPLIGLNRAFVAQGLKIMAKRNNIGLRILSDMARLDSVPTCYHLGYVIGPRINAGGRVGRSDLGSNLLSTTSEDEAHNIALELERYNAERKEIENHLLQEALGEAERQSHRNVIVIAGQGWHPGVIGIIAGRVKEKYQKPTAIIAVNDGIGKASCRSVKGVNFGAKIVDAKLQGILEDGGGHAMAAGFSIKEENIAQLHDFLDQTMAAEYNDFLVNYSSEYDAELTTSSLTLDLVHEINKLAPFGNGNYEPVVRIDDLFVINANVVGEKHISALLAPTQTAYGSKAIKAIAFNSTDNDLGALLIKSRSKISIIGHLQINKWNDRDNLQIIIHDVITEG